MKKNLRLLFLMITSCITNAQPVNPQPGENIWHLTAGIGTELDQCCFTLNSKIDQLHNCDLSIVIDKENTIESKLDLCCFTLESKIDHLSDQISTISFAGSGNTCAITAITSSTVITKSGTYCLAQNISGTITISQSFVTLDLNSFNVDGGLVISGGFFDIVVENGSIVTTSFLGVNNSANNVTLKNIVIQTGPGMTGSAGAVNPSLPGGNGGVGGSSNTLNNTGNNLWVIGCKITSGTGGAGGIGGFGGNNPGFPPFGLAGGDGGAAGNSFGIHNFGSNLIVEKSVIIAGLGGTGGQGGSGGDTQTPFMGVLGTGGNGGVGGFSYGIFNNIGSQNVKIIDSVIQTLGGGAGGAGGFPGVVENGPPFNTGIAGNGAMGGSAITCNILNNCNFLKIIRSTLISGNGGAGGNGAPGSPGGNGGNGSVQPYAIFCAQNNNLFVVESTLQCGNGGNGGNGGNATPDPGSGGGNGGNGGMGGFGVYFELSQLSEMKKCNVTGGTIGGAGGTGGLSSNILFPNGTPGAPGANNAAIFIDNMSQTAKITGCSISNVAQGILDNGILSNIYSNLVYDYLTASTAYSLTTFLPAIDSASGTSFATANNILQNIHNP